MRTECTRQRLRFQDHKRREVIGQFNGGRMTTDGGGILLRETDLRVGLIQRLTQCFRDYRNPNSVEHSVESMVAQRVFGLALGYEDLIDHDDVRKDALIAMLAGKADLTGQARERDRDRGAALAGRSTLNRMELGQEETAATDRYKRIIADPADVDRLMVEMFFESEERESGGAGAEESGVGSGCH